MGILREAYVRYPLKCQQPNQGTAQQFPAPPYLAL